MEDFICSWCGCIYREYPRFNNKRWLCAGCQAVYWSEYRKVWIEDKRAKMHHLPGTLTIVEWLATLAYFNWKCAYCEGPYDALDHFIPVLLGGGTTVTNSVPACKMCNSRKNAIHPDLITFLPQGAIERIRVFLEGQKLVPN